MTDLPVPCDPVIALTNATLTDLFCIGGGNGILNLILLALEVGIPVGGDHDQRLDDALVNQVVQHIHGGNPGLLLQQPVFVVAAGAVEQVQHIILLGFVIAVGKVDGDGFVQLLVPSQYFVDGVGGCGIVQRNNFSLVFTFLLER